MLKGIDISEWQGSVNFESVKNSGIDYVILRAGYRNTVDSRFFEYAKKCKEVGLKILGVYFFSYALNKSDVVKEADFCVDCIKKAGIKPDYVFYDFEYDTVTKAAAKGVTLGKTECTSFTKTFCDRIRQNGFIPGVYTNIDYWNRMYDHNSIKDYVIWAAAYGTTPAFEHAIHQYSCEGRVAGINGNVDMNFYDENAIFKDALVVDETPVVKTGVTPADILAVFKSWFGLSMAAGTHKPIVDLYNTLNPLPMGYRLTYRDSYCDATVTAAFLKLNALNLIGGGECGVERHIQVFKNAGIWEENGSIIPEVGYICCYNWDDSTQPNDGFADHIGIVASVDKNASRFTVYEGNMGDTGYVGERVVPFGYGYIRGFAKPKYASASMTKPVQPTKSIDELAQEVLDGKWGNDDDRRNRLTSAGYDYVAIQKVVNQLCK